MAALNNGLADTITITLRGIKSISAGEVRLIFTVYMSTDLKMRCSSTRRLRSIGVACPNASVWRVVRRPRLEMKTGTSVQTG